MKIGIKSYNFQRILDQFQRTFPANCEAILNIIKVETSLKNEEERPEKGAERKAEGVTGERRK